MSVRLSNCFLQTSFLLPGLDGKSTVAEAHCNVERFSLNPEKLCDFPDKQVFLVSQLV